MCDAVHSIRISEYVPVFFLVRGRVALLFFPSEEGVVFACVRFCTDMCWGCNGCVCVFFCRPHSRIESSFSTSSSAIRSTLCRVPHVQPLLHKCTRRPEHERANVVHKGFFLCCTVLYCAILYCIVLVRASYDSVQKLLYQKRYRTLISASLRIPTYLVRK